MYESDPAQFSASDAYDRLAPFYDAFTHHPAYPLWIGRLEALARSHGLTGRRALDVGCGTGKSALPLLELGYEVVGCDPSPAMLRAAAAKCGQRMTYVNAGLPSIPLRGPFDYVTCTNDVLNYVAPDDLRSGLEALSSLLRPGGVLVADTSTLAMYRDLFARDHVRARDTHLFAWTGSTTADPETGAIATAQLDIFTQSPDGRYDRVHTTDVQRHHPVNAIRTAIEAAGLTVAGVYGHGDDGYPERPLHETRHTKAIWVATKP